MSKVVTIPKDRNPFVVIVNGVKHEYPAGATTEVPDEVADVIEKYVGAKPKPDPNAGGVSWNDLKDKPFYEETKTVNEPLNITWDGNTEGLVSVGDWCYKVSDIVLTDEQIKSATVFINGGSASMSFADGFDVLVSQGLVTEELALTEAVAFCRKDGASFANFVFPEKGIYFASNPDFTITALTTTEPVQHTKTIVKQIDPKYLPSVGGIKYVTIDMDEEDNYTANATYEQILEWIKDGLDVKCILGWDILSLVYSDGIRDISMMASAYNHKFACVVYEGVPVFRCVEIFQGDTTAYVSERELTVAT